MAIAISIGILTLIAVIAAWWTIQGWTRGERLYRNLKTAAAAPRAKTAWHQPQLSGVVGLATKIGQRLPPSAANASKIQRRLYAAGYRALSGVAAFQGIRVMVGVALTIVVFTAISRLNATAQIRMVAVIMAALAGFRLPDFVLARLIQARQKRIRRALPDALDLMIVCAEAGLAIDRSFRSVTEQLVHTHREIAEEFSLVTAEIAAGLRRKEALENLSTRTGEPEVRKFVAVLTQADRFGSSIGEAMRTHAEYMRVRRRQEAEARASKVSVKLIFPIFVFILPCMFLVTAGPAAVQIVHELLPALSGAK